MVRGKGQVLLLPDIYRRLVAAGVGPKYMRCDMMNKVSEGEVHVS